MIDSPHNQMTRSRIKRALAVLTTVNDLLKAGPLYSDNEYYQYMSKYISKYLEYERQYTRMPTAYNLFVQDQLARISQPAVPVRKKMVQIGVDWRNLDDAQKSVYIEKAQRIKESRENFDGNDNTLESVKKTCEPKRTSFRIKIKHVPHTTHNTISDETSIHNNDHNHIICAKNECRTSVQHRDVDRISNDYSNKQLGPLTPMPIPEHPMNAKKHETKRKQCVSPGPGSPVMVKKWNLYSDSEDDDIT